LVNGWWAIAIAPSTALIGAALLGRQLLLWQMMRQAQLALEDYDRCFDAQLAEEVKSRTHSLDHEKQDLLQARERAEAASQGKSDLLALVGHELRTPLHSIVGYGQLMAEEPALPEQYRTTLDSINMSSEYLLGLVNELLGFSKFEASQPSLTVKRVHLPILLSQLESLFKLQAKQRNLRLRCSWNNTLPEYIWADEIKLRQILINLLANALKFTQVGHVILRTWVNGQICFEVEDTGPGIPSSDLPNLFEPFRQGCTATQNVSPVSGLNGVGLGLWVSHSLVKLMDGELTVISQVGQGSKFRVSLPLRPAEPIVADSFLASNVLSQLPQTEKDPGRRTGEKRTKLPNPSDRNLVLDSLPLYRILVVDDVALNRKLLVKFLEEVGVEAQEASSGEEAIVLWQTWHPQLILMDMRMPGMDGYEAVRQIRARESPDGAMVPILAVTANTLQSEHDAAIAAGCQDVIHKPFRQQDVLLKVVNRLDSQMG
jgi:signal transduction histidine kinase/ActR/RegA family two-component response regulator